jgi:hypothetical protein
MRIEDLKVGDKVYISEMIDWEKAIEISEKLARKDTSNINNDNEKMNPIRDLKSGDKVYIKDDLIHGEIYDNDKFVPGMRKAVNTVRETTNYHGVDLISFDGGFYYEFTPEMIDWGKTAMLNKNIPKKDTSNIKPTYDGTVLSGDDIEVTRHRDDKEDLEKAVMMLLLKKEGYSFGDVRRIVKNTKVKWVPKDRQKFFFINPTGNISSDVYYGAWNVHEQLYKLGNCFKTKEEAKAKAEQIMRILQEGR